MFYDFKTITHAKWILTGEHAVLRGCPALVFPLLDKNLTLNYTKSCEKLTISCKNLNNINLQVLFQNVLEYAFKLLDLDYNTITGHFDLICNIPIGTGLGASAALCVAISRWLIYQNILSQYALESFSKQLEDLFHGTSSGLDIAGVANDTGIVFQKGNHKNIKKIWSPQWYLSFSDQLGITSQCIEKIELLFQRDPCLAKEIDEHMQKSVQEAIFALESDDPHSLQLLKEAIIIGNNCFKQWGLINNILERHINYLYAQGAIAVKPTGSGGGGHVISLWDKPPPKELVNLIAV